jgi:N-methylhydantoinase B
MNYDPILLEVYKHLFSAIAEEMGVILLKASYSPNIKERRDFSCAIFDSGGNMIAQAAHIPVHLGSMPLSVAAVIHHFSTSSDPNTTISFNSIQPNESLISPGDVIILNDPFMGGTHLPDITLITPIFLRSEDLPDSYKLIGFAASRAHHSDVGGMSPGSMPIAREIFQEGLRIPPVKLYERGKLNQPLLDMILSNVRTPVERYGDLFAQYAANKRGVARFLELVDKNGEQEISHYMSELLAYTERITRQLIADLPDGRYRYTDYLDDDGFSNTPVPIKVEISISGEEVTVDFSGSAPQQAGSINAVYAITLSCVYYVFRSLMGLDVPNNSGCMVPIKVIAPEGSVVNALSPAAVAGGNVETSQRIVDVLLGALSKAVPEKVPAASQGTMNNLTIGGWDTENKQSFAYYETIGGGMGARPNADGLSAIHTHMTNTLNTPIEALEFSYPIRVIRYEVRRNSGGNGRYKGGDGIRRDLQILVDGQLSLLTERRKFSPYGLQGGEDGKKGENLLISGANIRKLGGKGSFDISAGDIISIQSPGGGGYGSVIERTQNDS